MSTPLYAGLFLETRGATARYRLRITHPDEEYFGTDAIFAWKLLSDFISLPQDDTEDPDVLAKRYVRAVRVSAVSAGAVVERGPGFFRVARDREDDEPEVVYEIEVSEPALLAGIEVGEVHDVYHFVELDRPATPQRRKAAAKPAPGTLQSFLAHTLELVAPWPVWLPHVVDSFVYAAGQRAGARPVIDDAGLLSVAALLDAPSGFRSLALGLASVERSAAGQPGSAEALAAEAEGVLPAPGPARTVALSGLIPAWHRLRRDVDVARAVAELAPDALGGGADRELVSACLAGIAGRPDELRARLAGSAGVPTLFGESKRACLRAIRGLARAGDFELVRALCAGRAPHDVAIPVAEGAIDGGHLERYLAELPAWPQATYDILLAHVLARLESHDPEAAARAARGLLSHYAARENGPYFEINVYALSLLSRTGADIHGEPFYAPFGRAIADPKFPMRFAYAAAEGADARGILTEIARARTLTRLGVHELARVTTDRELAVAALKALVTHPHFHADDRGAFVLLADLGETSWVRDHLSARLDAIAAMPAGKRDLPCRDLARASASVGLYDHALRAMTLPSAGMRKLSARAAFQGFSSAGDWRNAAAALERIPDRDVNERPSAAAQHGVGDHQTALLIGPRAVPLRSRPGDDVRE